MFELNPQNISPFHAYSVTHLLPVLFFTLLGILLIRLFRYRPESIKLSVALILTLTMMASLIIWMIWKAIHNKFDWAEDLPFHLCNILPFLLYFALIKRSKFLFAILYFFVIVGTFQAIITPDLKEDFPHFIYFRYWIIHCGLVVSVVYIMSVLQWKINFKDLKNAIVAANIYLVFSLIINLITGGNYFFSMRKPDAPSLLDYLGPWPWYLLTGEFVMMALFGLLYWPIYNHNKKVINESI